MYAQDYSHTPKTFLLLKDISRLKSATQIYHSRQCFDNNRYVLGEGKHTKTQSILLTTYNSKNCRGQFRNSWSTSIDYFVQFQTQSCGTTRAVKFSSRTQMGCNISIVVVLFSPIELDTKLFIICSTTIKFGWVHINS